MISENTDVGFKSINIYLCVCVCVSVCVCVCVCVETLKKKIKVKKYLGIQLLPCNKFSASPP
jgi:hypothetical protein